MKQQSLKTSSPAAYSDVRQIMDLAIQKPGLRYRLKTYGAAVNFKQRCYNYRNLCREMVAETLLNLPGTRAETVYDILVIRQTDETGTFNRKGCILLFDHLALGGELFDPETGEEITLPNVSPFIVER